MTFESEQWGRFQPSADQQNHTYGDSIGFGTTYGEHSFNGHPIGVGSTASKGPDDDIEIVLRTVQDTAESRPEIVTTQTHERDQPKSPVRISEQIAEPPVRDVPTPPSSPQIRHKVFFSFGADDRPLMQRIVDSLESGGVDVWVDETAIGIGQQWEKNIAEWMEDCHAGVFVFSEKGFAKRQTLEMGALINRARRETVPIIQVYLPTSSGPKILEKLPLPWQWYQKVSSSGDAPPRDIDHLTPFQYLDFADFPRDQVPEQLLQFLKAETRLFTTR